MSYFDKVRATSSLTTLDLETIFITRTVSPTQIDLSVGDNCGSQCGRCSRWWRWLSSGSRYIRVSRVATGIKRPHLISVERVRHQASAVVGGDVRTCLTYFDKVRARGSLTPFDLETIFVAGAISPAEVDLSVGDTVAPRAVGAVGGGGGCVWWWQYSSRQSCRPY